MSTAKSHTTFYVAVALAWAIAFSLMVLIVSPSHAALSGYPVPAPLCLCGGWLVLAAWLDATVFAAIGFAAAAMLVAGERGNR
jgi:hypothetical protein